MRHLLPVVRSTVARTMDARHYNSVANHPTVRAWLGGDGASDAPIVLDSVLENPANVALATGHGGFIAVALGSGRYDVHSMFLPEGRGREATDAQRDAVAYMFSATDATELRTTVPTTNQAAGLFARRAGFELLFTSRVPWTGGTKLEAECRALSLDRWALRAQRTREAGEWFHAALTAAKAAAGSALESHDVDAVHDAMVGAVVLLLQAGNVEKAVRFYNVYAQVAHYAPIELLRARPVILDVVDAIVEVGASCMEVLRCR